VPDLKPLADPLFEGDVAHYWRDDGQGGGMVVSQADVSAEIEHNKQLQNNTPRILKADFWPEAHIPDIIILKWLNEEGLNIYDKNAQAQLRRKLNDPDWRFLRTRPGVF
jgi:hypothetical protein